MISTAMGEVQCGVAQETGAEYIVSNDSSCLMHLQGLLERQGSAIEDDSPGGNPRPSDEHPGGGIQNGGATAHR